MDVLKRSSTQKMFWPPEIRSLNDFFLCFKWKATILSMSHYFLFLIVSITHRKPQRPHKSMVSMKKTWPCRGKKKKHKAIRQQKSGETSIEMARLWLQFCFQMNLTKMRNKFEFWFLELCPGIFWHRFTTLLLLYHRFCLLFRRVCNVQINIISL